MRRRVPPVPPPSRVVVPVPVRVLGLALVALALRLLRLDALGDLEFDEIVSVRYAALPPDELLPALAGALFEHPPLYYLALGCWLTVTGVAPATEMGDLLARLLSVVPGTLLVPLTYSLGARLGDRRVGLLAALFVAIGPLPLFYSREARMYELVACLGLASSWLFVRALMVPAHVGRWAAFAVVGIAAVLVHYAGLLIVLAQPIAALLAGDAPRRRIVPGLSSVGLVLAAAGAWALGSSGVRSSLPALDVANLAAVPTALWHVWRELSGGPESDGWRTAVAGAALFALAAGGIGWASGARASVPVSLAAGFLAVALAVALGKPVQARYVLVAAPFVYLLVAAGFAKGGDVVRVLTVATVLLGVLPWAAVYYTTYRRADYGDITAFVAAHERPGDAILLTGPWQAWYFDYFYPRGGGQILHRVLPENAPPPLDPSRAAVELTQLAQSRRRVWFIQAGLSQADPTNFVERWLQRSGWPALRRAHQNAVLSLYALESPESRRLLRRTDFGGALRLAGGWVDAHEVPAADVVRLSLELELLRPLDSAYKASLRLVGADGQRLAEDFELIDVTRDDRPVPAWRTGERVTVNRGIWVPVSVNPQPYDLRLVLYHASTLEPLHASDDHAAGAGGEVSIGGVYVTQTRAQLPPPEGSYDRLTETYGGGDAFDTIHLIGTRWHQGDPSAAPLSFDLLWRMDGTSGTLHHAVVSVRDGRGLTWLESSEPLFSGSFSMREWRAGETLGERRVLDLTSLPPGTYSLTLRLLDARGRALSLSRPGSEVELRRFALRHTRPLGERLIGLVQRIQRRAIAPLASVR